jgi:hypothetical protein
MLSGTASAQIGNSGSIQQGTRLVALAAAAQCCLMTKGRQGALTVLMKPFRWSNDKNQQLGAQRSIHFEAVVVAIATGGLLDVLTHPNPEQYPGQHILVVEVNQYLYLVPYVEDDDYLFLKMIIPSRKATRDYLRQDTP